MQVVGLIGGTGWPATRDYYELINRLTQERLGRLHSAELRLWSFDFQSLMDVADQPNALERHFAGAAIALKNAGAQLLAVASNTGHLYLSGVHQVDLPIVHIAQACANTLAAHQVRRVGILATRRACAGNVFSSHFQLEGITIDYLNEAVAELLDQAIFSELEQGKPGPMTRQALLQAVKYLSQQGITHILLGCTELRPSLLPPHLLENGSDSQLHLRFWDSTDIHCKAIVDAALSMTTHQLKP
jgi:aspartate racemase